MPTFRPLIVPTSFLALLGLVFVFSSQVYSDVNASQANLQVQSIPSDDRPHQTYLPSVRLPAHRVSPFGFETASGTLASSSPVARNADNLGARWIRLSGISWRAVQPAPDGPYNFAALASFEADLARIRELGLTPMVVVNDYPLWATTLPKQCSAIKQEHFGRFANFMAALVKRYPDVQYWELGNEPDVDPNLVPDDAGWGCWGNFNDTFYGGGHYGNMLKAVAPVMRAAGPDVKILIGGLLLHSSNTLPDSSGRSRPARFLEGILSVGAAPHFDIVPYHGHSSYYGALVDHSGTGGGWLPDGPAKGKPTFLRQLMQKYGVSKPLFFNESSLGCAVHWSDLHDGCSSPGPDFYEAQANHVVRMTVRTLSVGVEMVAWYTLNGPGWRNGALLDSAQAPRPVYTAYRYLIGQAQGGVLPPAMIADYGANVEAYRFSKRSHAIDVVWSVDGTARTVTVPLAKFMSASDRNGNSLQTSIVGAEVRLQVGFSAIYIRRLP